jgi:RimJ/RimL family protein N-acetyltransferase
MACEVAIEPLTQEHYEQVGRWLSEPESNRWLYAEWRGRAVDERLVAVVAMSARNRLLLVRCDGVPAGLVALGDVNLYDRSAALWYVLGERSVAGRGVMSAAVGQAVQWAARELGLHSLHASVLDGNGASRRVLEKNGFREAGRLREAFRMGDGFVDRILYDRLAPRADAACQEFHGE